MTFFGFFSSVAHLHVERKLFCCYQNFISSAVQRNHGGTRKSVTSTTTNDDDKRRTNDERRTTLTIIIARQDSFRILGLISKRKLIILFLNSIVISVSVRFKQSKKVHFSVRFGSGWPKKAKAFQ